MSFTSFNFILFVVAVAAIYFVLPKKFRWASLLAASYAFYLLSSPKTFVFLIITTLTTYLGGILIGNVDRDLKATLSAAIDIDRKEKKALKEKCLKKKRAWMILVLLINFGILAFMKYFRVYLDTLSNALNIEWLHFDAGILIPLGISFYTFQSMSYIIDLYRSKYEPDRNLFKFALFVSWFPLILQGPISRHDQLADQLYEGHEFDYDRIKSGAQLVIWGFFKKLVIADRVGILVDTVFDNYTEYQGFVLLAGAIGYTIQIYADFSGGMDIASGVSQIFGIDLVKNFERPYFAKSITEFWRRWHITLGEWCRDYVFYPISLSKFFGKLGRNSRKILGERIGKLLPVIIAQLVTFTLIGIWHGAQFKYVAYGLYQAIFIVGSIVFEPQIESATRICRINTEAQSWKLFQIVRTFMFVSFGRFFSRATRFMAAIHMMKDSFVFNPEVLFDGTFYTLGLEPRDFQLLAVCILIWICISAAQEKGYHIREIINKQNIVFRWAVYIASVLVILIFGVYGIGYDASTFIYRTF